MKSTEDEPTVTSHISKLGWDRRQRTALEINDFLGPVLAPSIHHHHGHVFHYHSAELQGWRLAN